MLKNFIKKFIPTPLLISYHATLAKIAAAFYSYPSQGMYVIGVTGTKGKTSTANFIWSVLNSGGFKSGLIGTANIRIGEKESLNKFHMTMPGRFTLQKLLKQMLDAGCTHVVLEVTSEGINLHRHAGIIFDAAVFTNLTPEHLASHEGSFEKYKQTKGKLFQTLMNHAKQLKGKYVKRLIVANADDENSKYFLSFPADLKKTFSVKNLSDAQAVNIRSDQTGESFDVKNISYRLNILGSFNVYNALSAILVGENLGIAPEKIQQGIENLKIIPGRMEKIDQGQNFTVLVDYAHEKVSMNAALDAARNLAGANKVIVLLGAEGGGRDKTKRAQMGEAAAKKADFMVVSNVDPYDDDPKEIIHNIADAAITNGKVIGQNLFREPDRQKGIAKALSLAQAGDVVIITGKGAEQSMIIGNKKIPWDDREVVRQELSKLIQ